MNSELFKQVYTEARDYRKNNPGIDNGADFGTIASALYASKEFQDYSKMHAVMGMVGALMIPKDISLTKTDPSSTDKILADSPTKEGLALMFYVGYKIGKASNEVAQLEAIATK